MAHTNLTSIPGFIVAKPEEQPYHVICIPQGTTCPGKTASQLHLPSGHAALEGGRMHRFLSACFSLILHNQQS